MGRWLFPAGGEVPPKAGMGQNRRGTCESPEGPNQTSAGGAGMGRWPLLLTTHGEVALPRWRGSTAEGGDGAEPERNLRVAGGAESNLGRRGRHGKVAAAPHHSWGGGSSPLAGKYRRRRGWGRTGEEPASRRRGGIKP